MSALQPLCLLCFSVCDSQGCLTSCDHYFCSRCASRLPDPATGAPCPLCRKPFRTVRLDHAGVQQLLRDPMPAIDGGIKALRHQISHHRQACVRLKDALRLVHNRYTASEARIAELQQSGLKLREENERLRQRLHAQAAPAVSPNPAHFTSPVAAVRAAEAHHRPLAPSRSHSRPPSPWPLPSSSAGPAVAATAPLGWASTSAMQAKRPRSRTEDHAPLRGPLSSPSPHSHVESGAWDNSRLSDGGGAARVRRDTGLAEHERSATGAKGHAHPDSPMHFRMATPLAQSLQSRPTRLPDSALVPPTPRLFAPHDALRVTTTTRADHSLSSAPKPLQGLLDACFRTPR